MQDHNLRLKIQLGFKPDGELPAIWVTLGIILFC